MKITRLILKVAALFIAGAAFAEEPASMEANQASAIQWQFTNVTQKHPSFRSPYEGGNSLKARESAQETSDLTLYAGIRPWKGGELWINPEIDQGFGLSNTLGLAGFSSGEAYKIGANRPYLRVPRAFLRQVIALGEDTEPVDAGANQLAGTRAKDNITITVGKFSVVDIFDTNTYAHDSRTDFFNWSIIDSGAFDYAADPWGYTNGLAVEWNTGAWTLRGGVFQMSREPNQKVTGIHFDQFMAVSELERRYEWNGRPGKVRLLVFANRARMGSYADATALAAASRSVPDLAAVRRQQWRPGVALHVEQEIAEGVGAFVRLSGNDGRTEAFEFTEINRSLAAGLSIKGAHWGCEHDEFGLAAVENRLSSHAAAYFASGGMGILIGDGALRYGPERIAEGYYSIGITKQLALTLDLQRVVHPAYNRDRGPATIYGVRTHLEF